MFCSPGDEKSGVDVEAESPLAFLGTTGWLCFLHRFRPCLVIATAFAIPVPSQALAPLLPLLRDYFGSTHSIIQDNISMQVNICCLFY